MKVHICYGLAPAQDAVPNVRLTAAEMLRIIAAEQTLAPTTLTEFVPYVSAINVVTSIAVFPRGFALMDYCALLVLSLGIWKCWQRMKMVTFVSLPFWRSRLAMRSLASSSDNTLRSVAVSVAASGRGRYG